MSVLQNLINKCAAANETYYYAQKPLNDYCEKHYGTTPSDIDCDWIIDSLFGGCGPGNKMTEKEFDASMKLALEQAES
jgi:hypothetical protein